MTLFEIYAVGKKKQEKYMEENKTPISDFFGHMKTRGKNR